MTGHHNNNNINSHSNEPSSNDDYYKSDQKKTTVYKKNLTKKIYLNRLTYLQVFSTMLVLTTAVLQAFAIATNDWFVLNVNEYIPTSKGGLWYYCYIATNNMKGQYSCLRYEELPNFAIFINSRLYDSRILLVCSCGFCFILIVIELFGIMCLCLADTRGDLFDLLVAKRSNRKTAHQSSSMPPSPKLPKSRQNQNQHSLKLNNKYGEDMTNSARFTTSIIVNANNLDQSELTQTLKPTGYFAYLAISLITLVGSVMDFVLKVSGFALFDSYISRLLSYNHVFLAYRSYSYWMMIVSIVLLLIFWLFKVFSTKYVINLTRKLINTAAENASSYYISSHSQSAHSTSNSEPTYDSTYQVGKSNYTTIARIHNNEIEPNEKIKLKSSVVTFPPSHNNKSSFYYDMEANEDDLSSNSYSSRPQSSYFQEYLQESSNNINEKEKTEFSRKDRQEFANRSINSVIRF